MASATPFNPVVRELFEIRYLFDDSVVLTSSRLPELLPDFRPTPLPEAIDRTLASYRGGVAEDRATP